MDVLLCYAVIIKLGMEFTTCFHQIILRHAQKSSYTTTSDSRAFKRFKGFSALNYNFSIGIMRITLLSGAPLSNLPFFDYGNYLSGLILRNRLRFASSVDYRILGFLYLHTGPYVRVLILLIIGILTLTKLILGLGGDKVAP